MSFRLFIYYCALYGGWAALAGWGLSRLAPQGDVGRAAVQGMWLGLMIALGVGAVDAFWNLTTRQMVLVGIRVFVAVLVGAVGGFAGGWFGMTLYKQTEVAFYLVLGWGLTGTLIGASLGISELVSRVLRREKLGGALRKIVNGLGGGLLGGLLGGGFFLALRGALSQIFGKPPEDLLSTSAVGFVVLGVCIGLLVGAAQIVFKEAWLRVEAGFRPGREMILTKPEIWIGRGEHCDLGLFGGKGVEKTHARIVQLGGEYLLEDAGTPTGTFLNDKPIKGLTALRSGDMILVGNCALLFQERRRTRKKTRDRGSGFPMEI